jgi:NADP-reducing hydrogenase subunit HndB
MAKLTIEDLKKIKERAQKETALREGGATVKITIHMGTCGIAAGARAVMDALLEEMAQCDQHDIRVANSGCMGMCSSEPNVTVEIMGQEPVIYQHMDNTKIRQVFKRHVLTGEVQTDFALENKINGRGYRMKKYRADLLLCSSRGCHATESMEVKESLGKELARHGLGQEIRAVETGCNGFCTQGPIMLVQLDGILYQKLNVMDIPFLVEEHFSKGRPVKKLFLKNQSQLRRFRA